MAFDIDDNKVKSVLLNNSFGKFKVELSMKKEAEKNRKTYSFTLEPCVRARLERLDENQNYKNTSQFLNDFIKPYL